MHARQGLSCVRVGLATLVLGLVQFFALYDWPLLR